MCFIVVCHPGLARVQKDVGLPLSPSFLTQCLEDTLRSVLSVWQHRRSRILVMVQGATKSRGRAAKGRKDKS